MEVCPHCFVDRELIGLISSSGKVGDCEVCGAKKVPLMNMNELVDFFQELISNFRLFDGGVSLKSTLQDNWNFFASYDAASIILNEILPRISTYIKGPEDHVDYAEDIVENYTYWDHLKEELKWTRRFFPDIDYLGELGWDAFFNTQFELKPGDLLYRARVHHMSGLRVYPTGEMMAPDSYLAKGGRANPLGIPYLYLSDNPETVLYEIRALYLDELSIGTFHLKDEYSSVKIVDFTEETPLFQPTRINHTIKAKLLRERISADLSKPMRRYDSDVDYIPTQFICEFISVYTGAKGIQFQSSLHADGKNLVIFDQDLMQCEEVVLKKVNKLELQAALLI